MGSRSTTLPATGRKPGIILLCEQSEGPVEGLCRSYVYRLEDALKFVNTHVYVWMCAIDKDVKLDDCDRDPPPLTLEPPSSPAPSAGADDEKQSEIVPPGSQILRPAIPGSHQPETFSCADNQNPAGT